MAPTDRKLVIAAAVIGVGLGGFFDGILLHQVLQWHHLLSLVPGETWRSLHNQLLADGLFHVLMYWVTAWGLWLLWRARGHASSAAWQTPAAGLALGFGGWNVVDVAVFHWALGIHRIRVDVPDPLLYDLGWLGVFGIAFVGLGWWLLNKAPPRSPNERGKAAGTFLAIALVAVTTGTVAALPPPSGSTALVVFPPGSTAGRAYQAAGTAGAPVIWAAPEGGMLVVQTSPGTTGRLYRAGALLVTRSPALVGCAASIET